MNPYEKILHNLKDSNKLSEEAHASMFSHLIQLMGEEQFNLNFIMMADYCVNYDEFYYSYHKQFRQCDMYNMEAREHIGLKNYQKEKEVWDKRADDRDGYIANGTHLVFSIGGHLDMLFWQLVHASSELWDGVLKKTYDFYLKTKDEKTVI